MVDAPAIPLPAELAAGVHFDWYDSDESPRRRECWAFKQQVQQ